MSVLSSDPATRHSLLIRLRNPRDDEAWSEFMQIYEPVIYRMSRRRDVQDADAREIVQEVLISVASAIDRFDVSAEGSFRGWLGRITRNATVDRLRSLSVRPQTIDAGGVRRALDGAIAREKMEDEFEQDRREQLFRWAAGQVRRRTGEVNWIAFWKTAVDGRSIAMVRGYSSLWKNYDAAVIRMMKVKNSWPNCVPCLKANSKKRTQS